MSGNSCVTNCVTTEGAYEPTVMDVHGRSLSVIAADLPEATGPDKAAVTRQQRSRPHVDVCHLRITLVTRQRTAGGSSAQTL